MYSAAYNPSSTGTNVSIELYASNGSARIGAGTTLNATAGSLVIGSHLKLNDAALGNASNRPFNNGTAGNAGLLRYNDDTNSAEIYDGSVWVDVGYYAGTPLGAILAYPSNTAPSTSFMLCNGQTLNASVNTIYADLYTLIGTTYGGTNNTNFKLPDIQGRTIVGKNSSGTFSTLGQAGGAETHTLTVQEIPSHIHYVPSVNVSGSVKSDWTPTPNQTGAGTAHKHSYQDNGHTHPMNLGGWGINDQSNQHGGWTNNPQYLLSRQIINTAQGTINIQIDNEAAHTHPFNPQGSVASSLQGAVTAAIWTQGIQGADQSHNNLQPYIVLNYFIKVVRESKRYNSTTTVSDIRVKRNVVPLNSDQAIESIRGLQPKRYEYIDRNISEFAQHIGFIAQEVKLCIPESVRTKREYIPNIYSMAKLTSSSTSASSEKPGNALLTSVQHPITKLIKNKMLQTATTINTDVSINGVKLKLFNKSKECFYVCCVESIDDYNVLVEPLDAVTTARLLSADYFVYGQEIDDYHYMNNDAVFSTLVSAFQALDRKCKQQETQLNAIILKYNLNT
jgi:microcystin-dependent protein